MAQQRTDPEKIRIMLQYHARLRNLFDSGKLHVTVNGIVQRKIGELMKLKAKELGLSLRTFDRRKKELA